MGAIPPLHLPVREMTILGLLLIAIGTGGIKPCVASFGGDQFKLPEQAATLAKFFSLFYFTINAGSFLSTLLTPTLREDVYCFGQYDCYSLAFGVPAILMIISIVIFVAGKSLYKITKPTGNMVVLVWKCIGNAIVSRSKEKRTNPRSHWLEYSEPKYGKTLVKDVKILLRILVLYLPLPFFWALFDQQSSRWTFQATRMDGRIGGVTIKPDQMQVINPLLILAFIPLFEAAVYPILSKIGIRRPLQKLTFGGLLAALAFAISGFIELKLEAIYPAPPITGYTQLRIYNPMPCQYKFDLPDNLSGIVVNHQDVYLSDQISLPDNLTSWKIQAQLNEAAESPKCPSSASLMVTPMDKEVVGLSLAMKQNELNFVEFEDSPSKSKTGLPLLRFLTNFEDTLHLINQDSSENIIIENMKRFTVHHGKWTIYKNVNETIGTIEVGTGGVYSYALSKDDTGNIVSIP